MTKIVVDPASLKKYGATAADQFSQLNTKLATLVTSLSTVDFHGTNAFEFKTKSAEMATEYSRAMHSDMSSISDAVRLATSQIAKSLGGQPIALPATPAASVQTPHIAAATGVESLNTEALQNLVPTVTRCFSSIEMLLDTHLKDLIGTKWEGNAKETAVNAVRKFTTSAKTASQDAEKAITQYIQAQVKASTDADNALT